MAMNLGPGDDGDESGVLIEINTTPLIDVMLVLLVMLIITIPIQTHAVKIAMPAAQSVIAAPPPVVTIDVERDGAVHWNRQVVHDRQALEKLLRATAAAAVQPEVHLRADRQAAYRDVAAVLAAAQRQGVTRMGIVDDTSRSR